jgi:nitrate reductase NapD
MNITSAVVYSAPHAQGAVRAQLSGLPGVEIHAETGEGRFVVTVEDVPGASTADTVVRLHQLEGVQFAAMVYQYSDDEPESHA